MSVSIPVIGEYDLVVVGGGVGGVAAAISFDGSCYLAAQETFAGADFCSRPVIRRGSATADDPLVAKLYAEQNDSPIAFPLRVKSLFESELDAAGVVYEFGAAPIGLLEDGEGALAGVVFSGKCGAYAVLGRTFFDATPRAVLARLAGVRFTGRREGTRTEAVRVTIGPDDACEGLSGNVECLGPVTIRDVRGNEREWKAFMHSVELDEPADGPAAFSAFEQEARTRTWTRKAAWQSPVTPAHALADCIGEEPFLWGDAGCVDLGAFKTEIGGIYVIGPCASLARADAEKLLDLPTAISIGRRLAGEVARGTPIDFDTLRMVGAGDVCDTRCEPPREARRADTRFIEIARWPRVRDFGEWDVVVVGGGTGGAPAALAAARSGAKVLLLEAQRELGGIATLGAISIYWYGIKQGFTAEVTNGMEKLLGEDPFGEMRQGHGWNASLKAEWFRREILKAGGEIWYGATVTGAFQSGEVVTGVTVSTDCGFGGVKAKVVVDSTGSADVAYAAGCECTRIGITSLAIQGCGLPQTPVPPIYNNSDYIFVDDNDISDVTRAMVLARRRYAGNFDLSPIPGTRERRQAICDVTVSPVDVILDRTWEDAICRNESDFDSHGYTLHPLFHVAPPLRGVAYGADLPLRALLPKGYSGIIVTGLGIGCDRDAMPIFRMQADIQNHSYAAGLAAAMAAGKDGRVRRIDISSLQRKLVSIGMLPAKALAASDSREIPQNVLVSVASGPLSELVEIAALMSDPSAARPLLRQRLTDETDAAIRLRIAKLLAALGDDGGTDIIVDFIRKTGWDEGWEYTGMGQGGASESEVDSCIQCLALAHAGAARPAVAEMAVKLPAAPAFSHIRAVAAFAATFRDSELVESLSETLRLPEIADGDFQSVGEEFAATPESSVDTTVRNKSLRELCLAKALFLCGDTKDHLAEQVLKRYENDVRGYFARYARVALGHGRA